MVVLGECILEHLRGLATLMGKTKLKRVEETKPSEESLSLQLVNRPQLCYHSHIINWFFIWKLFMHEPAMVLWYG